MQFPYTDFAFTISLQPEAGHDEEERGEGHGSRSCRQVSRAMLLPHGRPGAWLAFVAVVCGYVIVQALIQRFA